MSLVRARQGVITRLSPHNANRTHLIPGGSRQWRNMLTNSNWQGAGGDYSVGNWKTPEGWFTQFWPPLDAEAWPGANGNAIHFYNGPGNVDQRGYVSQVVYGPFKAGQQFTLGCYVDLLNSVPTGGPILNVTVDSGTVETIRQRPIPPVLGWNEYSFYFTEDQYRMSVRVGVGTAGVEPAEFDMVLRAPMLVGGDRTVAYQPTGLTDAPWDETVDLEIQTDVTRTGYKRGVYGALTPGELFTHQVAELNCLSNTLYLFYADNKNYGMNTMRVWHSLDPGNTYKFEPRDGQYWSALAPGIKALWDANIGQTIQVRVMPESWL